MISDEEARTGLQEVRRLVRDTHWIQGSYYEVRYEEGDGVYVDGAVVANSKVVGCLVGLARLVGMKTPTFIEGEKIVLDEGYVRKMTELSARIEQEIRATIRDEFLAPEFYDPDESEVEPEVSIEGWNDMSIRTKEQVLAMLDRAIERTGDG